MKKTLICLLALATILVALVACGEEISSPKITLTDGLGNAIFTFENEASFFSVLSYEYDGKNVYSWDTTVGDESVTIISNESVDREGLSKVISQKGITDIEIYPKDFYTKLVYENKTFKAVNGRIPDSITVPYRRYYKFQYYYVIVNGEEVQITDGNGKFLGVWDYEDAEMTLYAKFEAQYITINVDLDGGKLDNIPSHLKIGADMSFLTIPEKTGYAFFGWFTADGIRLTDEKAVPFIPSPLGDAYQITYGEGGWQVFLKAVWMVNKHNVAYYVDGNLYCEKSLSYGEKVNVVDLPYDCCEYYWACEGGKIEDMPDKDVDLTAVVTLHTSNGKEIPSCAERVCDNCKRVISSVEPHDYDVKADCVDKTCLRCGFIATASASHEYEPTAACVDRKCVNCGFVLKKSEDHVVDVAALPACVCVNCGKDLVEEEGYYRIGDKVYMGYYPANLEKTSPKNLRIRIIAPLPLKTTAGRRSITAKTTASPICGIRTFLTKENSTEASLSTTRKEKTTAINMTIPSTAFTGSSTKRYLGR